jgi:pyruvate formate lyase activating enzyme
MTVDDVMAEVRKDAPFYETSGGGITVSGGEPLLQGRFVRALLEECKAEGYHTAVDTCGLVKWESMADVLPFVDLFLYDLKHADPLIHRNFTGSSNETILDNLNRLGQTGVEIEIRMPIVPTINDSREAIVAAAEILAGVDHISGIRLLPYHGLAGEKYRSVGRESTLPDVASPDVDQLEEIAGWMRAFGLRIVVPGAANGGEGVENGQLGDRRPATSKATSD